MELFEIRWFMNMFKCSVRKLVKFAVSLYLILITVESVIRHWKIVRGKLLISSLGANLAKMEIILAKFLLQT